MNIPIHAPVFSQFIPLPLLRIEAALEPFLGDDLAEVCATAADLGDPLFVCTAAAPRSRRLDAVCLWRKRAVKGLFSEVPVFLDYFNAAPALDQAAIREGKVPLPDLETAIGNWTAENQERQMVAINASKAAMRNAIRDTLRDCAEGGSDNGPIFPGYLAILETGEVGLFRQRGACIGWGRSSGVRFLFGELDAPRTRIYPPPDPV